MSKPCWPIRPAVWLVIGVLLPLHCIAQQSEESPVDILGAGEWLPLLNAHLAIIRLSRENKLSEEEQQRLISITPGQISDLLATEGYFSSSVLTDTQQKNGRTITRFLVSPGKPTRIAQVTLELNGAIRQNPAQAERILTLKNHAARLVGEVFRQSLWETLKNDTLQRLLLQDYPAAQVVASRAEIDPDTHSANLYLVLDSGPLFTFGSLEIFGLQKYPAGIITRLNTIRPGEQYARQRLTELQSTILNTGYFRSAFANINSDPAHAVLAPIRLEVTETESKRLSLGLGFSTDSGTRGQIKWLDRQFLDQDWQLESLLRADRQTQLLNGDLFFQPITSLFDKLKLHNWIPSITGSIEQSTLTGEHVEKIRNRARLSSPSRTNESNISIALFIDRRTIGETDIRIRRALIIAYSIIRRQLDDLLSPHQGYIAGLDIQNGIGGVLNKSSIARIRLYGLMLHPFDSSWTGIVRAEAGEIFGAREDSVPEDLLFRTGGDQSVRGYAFGNLGVNKANAIVGGNVLAVFSAELNYRITPQWALAVFTDAGNATASRKEFRFKHGSGVGIRWQSPVGLINTDLARAHETGEIRLHLSLGYGF